MNPKERIEQLVATINQANVEYYLNDNPTLTDNEYDSLLMELFRLEDEYPELKLPESPTQNVGTQVLDSFNKITHATPMFSLADVFNEEEIEAFVNRVEKEVENYTVSVSREGTTFVMTNTYDNPPGENPPGDNPPGENPPGEDPPDEEEMVLGDIDEIIPKTGALWWPVPVLGCGGLILIMAGCFVKRRQMNEEE